jgi:hypothetical protein
MQMALRKSKLMARRWLAMFHDCRDKKPCKYGHFDCSTFERGPCCDEVLALHPDLEDSVVQRALADLEQARQ